MQRWPTLAAVVAGVLAPCGPAVAATSTVDLLTEASAELDGAATNDYTGGAVAGLGDVNGDGLADVAVRAGNGEIELDRLSPETVAGRVYVLFGRLPALSTWAP